MNNINKNNIKNLVYGLAVLAILVMGAPVEASAQAYVNGYNTGGVWPSNVKDSTNTYRINPAPTPSYYPTPYATPVYTYPTPTVYSNTSTNTTNTTNTTTENTKTTDDSSLAANAVFGNNSFMPTGIIQWVFFAILVLFIIILVRKIFGAEARYHATPLKHD